MTDAELDARVQALSDEDVVLLADRNATSDLGYYRGFDVKIRLAQEVLRLRQANADLLSACKAVLVWRAGPEGPEVLFGDGAATMKMVRDAIALAEKGA